MVAVGYVHVTQPKASWKIFPVLHLYRQVRLHVTDLKQKTGTAQGQSINHEKRGEHDATVGGEELRSEGLGATSQDGVTVTL